MKLGPASFLVRTLVRVASIAGVAACAAASDGSEAESTALNVRTNPFSSITKTRLLDVDRASGARLTALDDSRILLAEETATGRSFSVVWTESGRTRPLLPSANWAADVQLAPDRSAAIFYDEDARTYSAVSLGGAGEPHTLGPATDACFAGPLVIAGRLGGGTRSELRAIDPATGDLRWSVSFHESSAPRCVASRDGTRVFAFTSSEAKFIVAADGTAAEVKDFQADDLAERPFFHPDGQSVFVIRFQQPAGRPQTLSRITLDGSHEVLEESIYGRINGGPLLGPNVRISPDGKLIAYIAAVQPDFFGWKVAYVVRNLHEGTRTVWTSRELGERGYRESDYPRFLPDSSLWIPSNSPLHVIAPGEAARFEEIVPTTVAMRKPDVDGAARSIVAIGSEAFLFAAQTQANGPERVFVRKSTGGVKDLGVELPFRESFDTFETVIEPGPDGSRRTAVVVEPDRGDRPSRSWLVSLTHQQRCTVLPDARGAAANIVFDRGFVVWNAHRWGSPLLGATDDGRFSGTIAESTRSNVVPTSHGLLVVFDDGLYRLELPPHEPSADAPDDDNPHPELACDQRWAEPNAQPSAPEAGPVLERDGGAPATDPRPEDGGDQATRPAPPSHDAGFSLVGAGPDQRSSASGSAQSSRSPAAADHGGCAATGGGAASTEGSAVALVALGLIASRRAPRRRSSDSPPARPFS